MPTAYRGPHRLVEEGDTQRPQPLHVRGQRDALRRILFRTPQRVDMPTIHIQTAGSPPPSPEDLLDAVETNRLSTVDSFLQKLQIMDDGQLTFRQWCCLHNTHCELHGRLQNSVDLEVAGLPCPDNSQAGLRRYEEGPTAAVFIAHAKRHVHKATPMIIIENTPDTRLNK